MKIKKTVIRKSENIVEIDDIPKVYRIICYCIQYFTLEGTSCSSPTHYLSNDVIAFQAPKVQSAKRENHF
jgi:hypothetical protein